jgi:hypothetical protein
MSDSFAECLVVASVAVGIWGCRLVWSNTARSSQLIVFTAIESVLCGLAALAKLNGAIATVIVLAMVGGTWLLASACKRRWTTNIVNWRPTRLVLTVMASIGLSSFFVFVALNPLMFAQPHIDSSLSTATRELAAKGLLGRAKFLVDFRREWSSDALKNETFKKDWLLTIPDRIRMTVWEGFGRFSPLGPRQIKTREPRPETESFTEYGRVFSAVWLPLVGLGLLLCVRQGLAAMRAGRPPLAWAIALYMAATQAIVILLIPLNWDRYYLPIQAPAAALVALGIAAISQRIMRRAAMP